MTDLAAATWPPSLHCAPLNNRFHSERLAMLPNGKVAVAFADVGTCQSSVQSKLPEVCQTRPKGSSAEVAECFHIVAQFVPLKNLCRCRLVSRFWNQCWCSEGVWIQVFSLGKHFYDLSIDMQAMTFLLKMLPSRLQKLDTTSCFLKENAMLAMAGSFEKLTHLVSYETDFPKQFDDSHLQEFAKGLTSLSASLRVASFECHSNVSDLGLSSLAASLIPFRALRRLCLRFDASDYNSKIGQYVPTGKIGDVALIEFGSSFSQLSCLAELEFFFDHAAITDEGVRRFASDLANLLTLTTVEISFKGTAVGDLGVQALAASFEKMTNLTSVSLHLENSNVGDAGVTVLSAILGQKIILDAVDMTLLFLHLTCVGIHALGANLARSSSIKSVSLLLNAENIHETAMQSLANNIAKLPKLKTLELVFPGDYTLQQEITDLFADLPDASLFCLCS